VLAYVPALAAAREPVDHFILNLPNDALAFCDVFVGLHARAEGEDQLPAVRALTPVPAVGGDNGGGGGAEKCLCGTFAYLARAAAR
jgi:hypothetical protein